MRKQITKIRVRAVVSRVSRGPWVTSKPVPHASNIINAIKRANATNAQDQESPNSVGETEAATGE